MYLGSIGVLLLLALSRPDPAGSSAGGVEPWLLALLAILLVLPASEVAVSLVNLDITTILRPRVLPKLQFDQGIPDSCRTLVVVPTLADRARAQFGSSWTTWRSGTWRTRTRISTSRC